MTFGFVRYPDAATWAAAAPFLQAALDHVGDTKSLNTVKADVDNDLAQLWLDDPVTGACITRRYGNTLDIVMMGGTLSHLSRMDTIMDAARHDGCTIIGLDGRPGWRRMLPGWKVRSVRLERAL